MKLRGFTLIELMSALLILSLLAMMSFRGLGAVLDARDQVRRETEKWKGVAAFFSRFQRDIQLSAPRPVLAADTAAHHDHMPDAGAARQGFIGKSLERNDLAPAVSAIGRDECDGLGVIDAVPE